MAVILEVKGGPMAGEKIAVRSGETVTFGRAAGRANFALPHDTFMSGIHFAVECRPEGAMLRDRNSSNGTFLNGARVKDTPLTNGDEVRSGQTSFSIRIVADEKLPSAPSASAPARAAQPVPPPAQPARTADPFNASEVRSTARPQPDFQPPPPPVAAPAAAAPPVARPATPPAPAAPPTPVAQRPSSPAPHRSTPVPPGKPPVFTVGSWTFSVVPLGWAVKAEFGMEQAEKEGFPASLTATEEMIGGNPALGPFVESQLSMLRQYLREPKIEAAIPPAIPGAEEKASVDVRYSTNDGQTIFYRRLYARVGNTVGTITMMTLDSDFATIRPAFDAIIGGLAFQATASAK